MTEVELRIIKNLESNYPGMTFRYRNTTEFIVQFQNGILKVPGSCKYSTVRGYWKIQSNI